MKTNVVPFDAFCLRVIRPPLCDSQRKWLERLESNRDISDYRARLRRLEDEIAADGKRSDGFDGYRTWQTEIRKGEIDKAEQRIRAYENEIAENRAYLRDLEEGRKPESGDFKKNFEVDGWDVQLDGGPHGPLLFIELKPSLGDDYPAVRSQGELGW